MSKDNENISFLDDGPLAPSEPQGFSPEQMVRCEECLRANPPVRTSCLYCGAALAAGKVNVDHQNLKFKPVEDTARGYNNILLPVTANGAVSELSETAEFLKLSVDDLRRIIDARTPLPIARNATRVEADLINSRLESLGVKTIVVSDDELGLEQSPVYTRAADIGEAGLSLRRIGGGEGVDVAWDQALLLVTGRIVSRKVESVERKRRGETEIVEARELFTDELTMDLYTEHPGGFRITANNFDFSCLPKKSLVAAENFSSLMNVIRQQAAAMKFDDSFPSLRQALDTVWPSGQRTGSRGWRRERPGKYNIEALTETSNLNQFTRYSRLRHFLMTRSTLSGEGF